MMHWLFGLIGLAVAGAMAGEGQELIGKAAPELNLDHWRNSHPLKLKELRGKVVLVRWWTAPDCPYCAATAPALNRFHRDFVDDGLVVIGAYHHKSDDPLVPEEVAAWAQKFGFEFPIGIDTDWKTLEAWWLKGGTDRTGEGRRFTSVSFLLDRRGVIRFVHPGGQYVAGEPDYAALKTAIERLLREK